MNDTTFYETVRDRKALVPSARHKVNGSKSKKCILPSDNLTAAEKKKLNGPMKTYAINQPMPWSEFKSMPHDLQQEHIDYIQNRFELGLVTISRVVFGMSDAALTLYAKRVGLKAESYKGARDKSKIDALRAWAKRGDDRWPEVEDVLNSLEEARTAEPIHEEPTPEEPVHNEPPATAPAFNVLRELSMILDGSAAQISETLFAYLAGRHATVEVTIKFHN